MDDLERALKTIAEQACGVYRRGSAL